MFTCGAGVAVLSFDSDYKRDREIIQREKPRHVAEGVAFGFRDLGIGLFRQALIPIYGS